MSGPAPPTGCKGTGKVESDTLDRVPALCPGCPDCQPTGCDVRGYSSSVCERGTRCCVVDHSGVEAREPREWTIYVCPDCGRDVAPSQDDLDSRRLYHRGDCPHSGDYYRRRVPQAEQREPQPVKRVQVVEKDAHRAQVVAEVAEALRGKTFNGSGFTAGTEAADFILRREADR